MHDPRMNRVEFPELDQELVEVSPTHPTIRSLNPPDDGGTLPIIPVVI